MQSKLSEAYFLISFIESVQEQKGMKNNRNLTQGCYFKEETIDFEMVL